MYIWLSLAQLIAMLTVELLVAPLVSKGVPSAMDDLSLSSLAPPMMMAMKVPSVYLMCKEYS